MPTTNSILNQQLAQFKRADIEKAKSIIDRIGYNHETFFMEVLSYTPVSDTERAFMRQDNFMETCANLLIFSKLKEKFYEAKKQDIGFDFDENNVNVFFSPKNDGVLARKLNLDWKNHADNLLLASRIINGNITL